MSEETMDFSASAVILESCPTPITRSFGSFFRRLASQIA